MQLLNIIIVIVLRRIKVFHQILLKQIAIFDFRPVKVLQVLNYRSCPTPGQGVSVDAIEATKYCKLAANQGYVLGQINSALYVPESWRFLDNLD
jgi:hypothetical protein